MRLSIHTHDVALPPDLGSFLQKHLTRPLSRLLDDPAAQLSVHLGDLRRKKGGIDRVCRVSFRIPGARVLHVESTQDDIHASLIDAGERLRRLVKRELEKMRSDSRRPMHRPLGRSWRERSSRRGVTPDGAPAAL
jgi:ribosome-associated translation inhibitor RaiA